MKTRKYHKFITVVTAVSLISGYAAIDVNASMPAKVEENVTQMIESGAENIEVCLRYEDIDAVEISFKAEELSYEYAETLDKNAYSDEEIGLLRFDYYAKLNDEMNTEARNERTDFILSELGVSPENAECAVGYPKITCFLSPEQIAIAEKMELITGIVLRSDWLTSSDLGYTASDVTDVKILQNTLEQLVSKDTSFTNNSFIYSDKYKFALESGAQGDKLIVYGIPEEDCYGEWRKHIATNSEYSYGMVDWFPAGENRSVYSGFEYHGVVTMSSTIKFEKPIDVLFFVNDEVPYYAENVDDASEQLGFDISPYIYSNDMTSTEYTVPEGAEPTKYGDVNFDSYVNVSDVVSLNLFLLNSEAYPLTDTQIANADCFKDNIINSSDVSLLLNYVAMIIDESKLGE